MSCLAADQLLLSRWRGDSTALRRDGGGHPRAVEGVGDCRNEYCRRAAIYAEIIRRSYWLGGGMLVKVTSDV